MSNNKFPGKITPLREAASRASGKFRNVFKNYILTPLVIGAAVISVNAAVLSSASAKSPPKGAKGADIVLQSDTLAIRPSLKSKPLSPKTSAAVQALLSKISHTYPDVLKTWAAGRSRDASAGLEPFEFGIQEVNQAKFDQIEYTGRSVIVEPDLQTIFINADAKLDKSELALALCSTLSSYGGFRESSPFQGSDVVSTLMAYSVLPPAAPSAPFWKPAEGETAPVLREREAVDLWLAQFTGIREFVNAYARDDPGFVRRAYDQKFGAGKYDELMAIVYQWQGPGSPLPNPRDILKKISDHMRQSGLKGTAWDEAKGLAIKLGYKLPSVP